MSKYTNSFRGLVLLYSADGPFYIQSEVAGGSKPYVLKATLCSEKVVL